MISDILSQVVVDLDAYLTDPTFDLIYIGETRDRLLRLRDEADHLRSVLDMPPVTAPPADDNPDQPRSARSRWIAWMMLDESAAISPIFNQKDLLGRGWSKGQIRELLGEPDGTAENPHSGGFAPMKCWRQDRVLQAEDAQAFKEHRARKQQ